MEVAHSTRAEVPVDRVDATQEDGVQGMDAGRLDKSMHVDALVLGVDPSTVAIDASTFPWTPRPLLILM